MGQTQPLRTVRVLGEGGHLHQLQPCAVELEEVGTEPGRRILVSRARHASEVPLVERAEALEIVGPDRDVVDHGTIVGPRGTPSRYSTTTLTPSSFARLGSVRATRNASGGAAVEYPSGRSRGACIA